MMAQSTADAGVLAGREAPQGRDAGQQLGGPAARPFCDYIRATCMTPDGKKCRTKREFADRVQERIDEFRLARSPWRVRAVTWQGIQFGEYGDGAGQRTDASGEYWNSEGRSEELRKINFATLQATSAPLVVEVSLWDPTHSRR